MFEKNPDHNQKTQKSQHVRQPAGGRTQPAPLLLCTPPWPGPGQLQEREPSLCSLRPPLPTAVAPATCALPAPQPPLLVPPHLPKSPQGGCRGARAHPDALLITRRLSPHPHLPLMHWPTGHLGGCCVGISTVTCEAPEPKPRPPQTGSLFSLTVDGSPTSSGTPQDETSRVHGPPLSPHPTLSASLRATPRL